MDDCIIFTGCKDTKGYGLKRINGRLEKAHRVAWRNQHGEIPEGLHILHHCDNPPCINIDHLFIGTNQDNVNDKMAKGRQARPLRGEENGYSKLTNKTVHYIRKMRGKITQVELAKELGVAQVTISDIQIGKTWRHI